MKTTLKILGIFFITIFIITMAGSASIKVFENAIAQLALDRLSKEIEAPVELGDINLNILRKFPLSTVALQDLWVKSPDNNDTIAGIKSLYLSVNSREAINGKYDVEKIEIDGLEANYNISSDSISNIDFLLKLTPEGDTTTNAIDTSSLQLKLKEILLRNITCTYFDSTSQTGAKVHIPIINLKGNINDDNYTVNTGGNITITDVYFGDYNLNLMQEASLDFDVDYRGDSITISSFIIKSDGIYIEAGGIAQIGKNVMMDAVIKKANFDIGEIFKYLPEELKQEQGLISAKGIIDLNSEITGEYNDSTLPLVDANFNIKDIAIYTKEYPEITNLSTSGHITNGKAQNNATTSIDISNLNVKTHDSQIKLQAQISNIDQPTYNITTDGSLLIDEFIDYIPDSIVEYISGRIKWNIKTSGTLPKTINDDFNDYALARTTANIQLENINSTIDNTLSIKALNGKVSYKPNLLTIEHLKLDIPEYDLDIKESNAIIAFDGKTTDINNIALDISQFNLAFDNSTIDVSGKLTNLYSPFYQIKTKAKLNLADLLKFAPDTLVSHMSGLAYFNMSSSGHFDVDSLETQGINLAFKNSSIDLITQGLTVKMVDTLLEIQNMDLDLRMKPDMIAIDNFEAHYKTMSFEIDSTVIDNFYDAVYLNQNEKVSIYTDLRVGDIDYDLIEPFMLTDETENTEANNENQKQEPINYTYCLRGKLAINNFVLDEYEVDSTMTLRDIDISDLSTYFRLTDSLYVIDQFQFNALGGNLNTSLRYTIKEDQTEVRLKNKIDGMDFKILLKNMDNFGQTDLTHENISGQLVSDFSAQLTLLNDTVDMSMTKVKGDITLTNGGVYNFEPVKELSKFTGINELDNIRFQTLKTSLFVLKGAAYIPRTEIVNSAVDLTAYGMQSFGEDYEYHLELNLGDVLTGKREGLMKRQAKAATDEDKDVKRNGVNIIAYSLDGKTKNKFDNKKAQNNMTRQIRLKKNMLDLKFLPKLFKFDTTVDCNE